LGTGSWPPTCLSLDWSGPAGKRMVKKGKPERRKPSFYSDALDEAERVDLEEALVVDGIDQEIALLRLKLRDIIARKPNRLDLHIKTAGAIARLVRTRYTISREQKNSLKQAITKVITEVAVPLGVKVLMKE
jgi:hypothetical protein